MAAKNDVTGDSIQSKTNSNEFRDNWDRIFNKKKVEDSQQESKDEKKESNNGSD